MAHGHGSDKVWVMLKDIYDKFVAASVELAKKRVVGDPFDEKTQQGPQVDRDQFESILGYIKQGSDQGATLSTGAAPPVLSAGATLCMCAASCLAVYWHVVQCMLCGLPW